MEILQIIYGYVEKNQLLVFFGTISIVVMLMVVLGASIEISYEETLFSFKWKRWSY